MVAWAKWEEWRRKSNARSATVAILAGERGGRQPNVRRDEQSVAMHSMLRSEGVHRRANCSGPPRQSRSSAAPITELQHEGRDT